MNDLENIIKANGNPNPNDLENIDIENAFDTLIEKGFTIKESINLLKTKETEEQTEFTEILEELKLQIKTRLKQKQYDNKFFLRIVKTNINKNQLEDYLSKKVGSKVKTQFTGIQRGIETLITGIEIEI
jgi:hypothetical protein